VRLVWEHGVTLLSLRKEVSQSTEPWTQARRDGITVVIAGMVSDGHKTPRRAWVGRQKGALCFREDHYFRGVGEASPTVLTVEVIGNLETDLATFSGQLAQARRVADSVWNQVLCFLRARTLAATLPNLGRLGIVSCEYARVRLSETPMGPGRIGSKTLCGWAILDPASRERLQRSHDWRPISCEDVPEAILKAVPPGVLLRSAALDGSFTDNPKFKFGRVVVVDGDRKRRLFFLAGDRRLGSALRGERR